MLSRWQTPVSTEDEHLRTKAEWLRKMRGSLMVIAVLVASVTFQAGLNPPESFWQDDMATYPTGGGTPYFSGQGHFAGDPILRDKNYNRYAVYLAFNTLGFVQALGIIVLLMSEATFRGRLRLYLLRVFVIIHVIAVMVAYSIGCTRDLYDVFFSVVVGFILILFVGVTSFGVHCYYTRKEKRKSARLTLGPAAIEGV